MFDSLGCIEEFAHCLDQSEEMTAANYNPPIPFIYTMALLKVNALQNSTNMNTEY